MSKNNVTKYLALVIITAFALLGIKYLTQYLFSATVDWNIAIGVTAIALPLLVQAIATLGKKQAENQLKIEQVQNALDSLPGLQNEIGKLINQCNQINATISVIEEQLDTIGHENRRQERLLARVDAILETTIQQEQLHARVDKLSEAIAALQIKAGCNE